MHKTFYKLLKCIIKGEVEGLRCKPVFFVLQSNFKFLCVFFSMILMIRYKQMTCKIHLSLLQDLMKKGNLVLENKVPKKKKIISLHSNSAGNPLEKDRMKKHVTWSRPHEKTCNMVKTTWKTAWKNM